MILLFYFLCLPIVLCLLFYVHVRFYVCFFLSVLSAILLFCLSFLLHQYVWCFMSMYHFMSNCCYMSIFNSVCLVCQSVCSVFLLFYSSFCVSFILCICCSIILLFYHCIFLSVVLSIILYICGSVSLWFHLSVVLSVYPHTQFIM